MAGAYCRFCDQRCFVLRVMPDDARWMAGQSVHLATCAAGAAHDREQSGYDHTTAINPAVEDDEPTVADMVEVLSEVYKQLALITRRLTAIEEKIVGGTSVVSPTTGRTRPVTLVGRKDKP